MAIGAIIGIISSVISAVRAFSTPDTAAPQQASDKLFAKLDELGKGEISGTDLQSAFEKISPGAGANADKLFSRLDSDGDGKITQSEFTGSINRLSDQLGDHFMRLRLKGEGALSSAGDAGLSKDQLNGQLSGLISNFDRIDKNGDGRVSLKEMVDFGRLRSADAASPTADGAQVEMMLQVVRLMQAYGVVKGDSTTTAGNATTPGQAISDKV